MNLYDLKISHQIFRKDGSEVLSKGIFLNIKLGHPGIDVLYIKNLSTQQSDFCSSRFTLECFFSQMNLSVVYIFVASIR